MKFVNQSTGEDNDKNNINLKKIERKRKTMGEEDDTAIDFKMICTRCQGTGHMSTECFVDLKGSKDNYVLIPEIDNESVEDFKDVFTVGDVDSIKMAMKIIHEFENRKKKKDKKKKKKKHK